VSVLRYGVGPVSLRVPDHPIVGIGPGSYVRVARDPDEYARVISARLERRHGAWGTYLVVDPVPTAVVLAGWGEYAVDVLDVEVV
jgi:hypothetical protein